MLEEEKSVVPSEKTEVSRLDFIFQRQRGSAYNYLKDKLFRRAFPEVGKIKIGKKIPYNKNGQVLSIPQKEDRFIITKTLRGEDGNFLPDEELMKVIADKTGQNPDKLTRIPIVFPANIPELNFQIWFVCYKNGILYCRGNGQEGRQFENGQIQVVPCPCEKINLPEGHPERCTPYGRLNCIPKYTKTFGGVWVFRTRSLRTIETLTKQLEYFYKIFDNILSRFVFQLTLNKEIAIINQKPQYIYTVSLLYDPDEDKFEDTIFYKIFTRVKDVKEKENLALTIEQEKRMIDVYVSDIDKDETREEVIQELKEEYFPGEEEQKIANEINEKLHSAQDELAPTQAQSISPPIPQEKTLQAETPKSTSQEKMKQSQPVQPTQIKEPASKTTARQIGKPIETPTDKPTSDKINKGQILIIRRELTKALNLQENDPILTEVENLSFEKGTAILKLIREGKHSEAYSSIKKASSEKEKPKAKETTENAKNKDAISSSEPKTETQSTSNTTLIYPVTDNEEDIPFNELDEYDF